MLKKHEDDVKTTQSAQRKADDRPWQRESSGALPESTSPDPTRGDKTKGQTFLTTAASSSTSISARY